MSDKATPLTSKLTGYDFHSYLDGQISDEDFARIEKTVSTHPKVILQLQQCIMIGERFQDLYGEPITGPMQNSQSSIDRPQFHEPALVNDDEISESEDALVAIDALEISNDESYASVPPTDDMSLADDFEDALKSDNDNDYQQFYSSPDSEAVFQASRQNDFQEEYRDEFSDSFVPAYDEQAENEYNNTSPLPSNSASTEEIQVENLLQGISEVEALSQRQDDPLVGQYNGIELYNHPDQGWLANKIHGARDWLRAKINLYRYKIQQKRLNKLLNESGAEPDFGDMSDFANEFDYDIDSDIQRQDPPRWQFWKSRAPKINLDVDAYHQELTDEPFGHTGQSSALTKLREWTWNILTKLHIPEHRHNHVLVASAVIISFFFGMVLSSKPIALDATTIIYQAIDAHKYYASRDFEPLQQGLTRLSEDLAVMAKTIGTPLPPISLKNTDFQRTGSTLLPSINGYANMQLFQNKNKQNVSLFVTAWSDPELKDNHVTCKVPAGISSVCMWQDDNFYYVLTADISLSRVRTFAERLAAQPRPQR